MSADISHSLLSTFHSFINSSDLSTYGIMAHNGDGIKSEGVDTDLGGMSIEELHGGHPERRSRDTMEHRDVADQPETCELASDGGCGRCNYCKAGGLGLDSNDANGQFEGASTNTMSGSTFDDRLHTPGGSAKSSPNTPNMSTSGTSKRSSSNSRSPKLEDGEHEDIVGGDITLKLENGKPPKLSRKSSQKIIARPPPLFADLPDFTEEAMTQFQVIRDCIYGSKYMGSSDHDALGCDCSEEWRGDMNHACGEDSDCINRATKMECMDDECNCGAGCQNQRFQRKQFANVSVIKTEKKGYGLRADSDLQANDFIFEYIGEVINEPVFRRRTIQYDEEGIKHFYFMSLTKSEFVDATKKGNLGRFCNHSCNPNCYVDKWVVGSKLRMGIFAERNIKAGEELVFNYNVDRYGADPQPCYCAEPNCTGYIGGKTQTERATKLSHTTIEALGIDDGDGWDTAVAKKPRKKKTGEDDEEYVSSIQPRGLEEDGVTKVMATLMQCKEKWIAVKVLDRLQRCDDDRVRNRVVRMHGYQILGTTLKTWIDDNNVVLQVLDVLYKLPRLTKNKISDSNIEATVESLITSEHEDVTFESKRLLEEWSKLEVAYRIPRKKFDPTSQPIFERRASGRDDEAREAPTTTPTVATPTGPRSNVPQRSNFFNPSRAPMMRRQQQRPLPSGWFATLDKSGNTYYYNDAGVTTWQRPTIPAVKTPAPKGPTKATQSAKAIQDIIDSLTKAEPTSSARTPSTPQPEPVKEKKSVEKWRSLPAEKQMKLYENTLFPHIKYVMDKFKNKLPRDDLKKFAKEISKKIVNSDFKNDRVQDPTKISERQEHKVKKHVREFFIKVVAKKVEHDRKRAARKAQEGSVDTPSTTTEAKGEEDGDTKGEESDMEMFDEEGEKSSIETPSDEGLKRKREDEIGDVDTDTLKKRIKESATPEPPPPPPPPPAEDLQDAIKRDDEDFAKQEAELMRENEEALRKENEDAMREAQMMQTVDQPLPGSIDAVDATLQLNGQGVKNGGVQVNCAVALVNGHGNGAMED